MMRSCSVTMRATRTIQEEEKKVEIGREKVEKVGERVGWAGCGF